MKPDEVFKNYENLPVQGDIVGDEEKGFVQLKFLE